MPFSRVRAGAHMRPRAAVLGDERKDRSTRSAVISKDEPPAMREAAFLSPPRPPRARRCEMWTTWLERTLVRRRVDPARATVPTRVCVASEPDTAEDEALADRDECGEALEPAE